MRPQTRAEAEAWLAVYESQNADLPPDVRRLLGLFALAMLGTPRVVIEEILGYASSVLTRDHARRWWLVLAHSGCARHWPGFKRRAQAEGTGQAWRWLVARISRKRRALILWRLGTNPWRASPAAIARLAAAGKRSKGQGQGPLWFKGGCWSVTSSWTKICITGKGLGATRPLVAQWQRFVHPAQLRLLEREVHARIDPDVLTVPQAKWEAVRYVKQRWVEVIGNKRVKGWTGIAWFFQQDIPLEGRHVIRHAPGRSGYWRQIEQRVPTVRRGYQ